MLRAQVAALATAGAKPSGGVRRLAADEAEAAAEVVVAAQQQQKAPKVALAAANVGGGAAAGALAKKSGLAPECEALVLLAEPGDVYAHYNAAMSAAAVSTQIKAIEQRLGLKARGCPPCPTRPPSLLLVRWGSGMRYAAAGLQPSNAEVRL
jgi:hypothetical protein